jgi:Yip1 domain
MTACDAFFNICDEFNISAPNGQVLNREWGFPRRLLEITGHFSLLDKEVGFGQAQSMEQINSIPEPPAEGARPAMSLTARLFNVFTEPGEVFEQVKNSKPAAANWLVPALILAAAGIISTLIIFSQPVIIQKIHDQQISVLDQQVKDGKMTQAQEDQAVAIMDKFAGPGMLKIFGSVGAVFVSFVRLFWWAFVLWLMASLFLKIKIPFMKAAEVAGLAAMILVLGAVVTTLLTVITGKLGATLSPALLISDFNLKNKMHMLLAVVNVFNLWLVWVSAAGLSRLAGAPFGKALLIVGIYWLAYSLFFIAIGAGQMAL